MFTLASLVSHLRVRTVWTCYVAENTLEGLVVMILLIHTELDCNFVLFYQTMMVPAQTVVSFVAQWISGIFTDQTAPYAHRVLQGTCLLSLIVDALAFLFGPQDKYLLLVLCTLRYTSLVQLNNSVGKVIKLHLNVNNVSEEDQLPIINNMTVFAEFAGRMLAVLFGYSVPLILITYYGDNTNFNTIKLITFGTIFAVDCLAFTTSLFIPASYVNSPTSSQGVQQQVDEGEEQDEVREDQEEEPDDDGIVLDDASEKTLISARKSTATTTAMTTDITTANTQSPNCFISTKNAFVKFFSVRLLWMATLQIILGISIIAILSVVLRFNLAQGHKSQDPPTKRNLCNGFIYNLLLQDLLVDGIRAVSAVFYQVTLTHMRPWYFFSRIWFLIIILVGLLVGVTYWEDMPDFLGSIVLGIVTSLTYMWLMYTNSTITAVLPPEIYGLTFAIQGSMNTATLLLAAGIGALQLPLWGVTTIILAITGLNLLWNIIILVLNKRAILNLDVKDSGNSCWSRYVYGYFDNSNTGSKYKPAPSAEGND